MTKKTRTTSTTSTTTNTSTQVKTATLTSLEEKVVRMRRGLPAPGDHVLEQIGQNHPETAAQLAAMEQRAYAAVGARSGTAKRKIVNSLLRKN